MQVLGIDIGGSGIKGAPVDTDSGRLVLERFRLRTPEGAKPPDVASTVAEIVRHFSWQGPVGCTFPAVIRHGVAASAANISEAWIGVNVEQLFSEKTGCPTTVLNDADAAAIAEMRFGACKGRQGVVFVLTFGTGIGSAIFVNGQLFPNTELGHLEIKGKDAEAWASDRARKKRNLSWQEWAERVDEYLARIEALFSPDLIIIGGGVSKQADNFLPLLHTQAPVVVASMLNDAGIVGAALAAADRAMGLATSGTGAPPAPACASAEPVAPPPEQ